MNLSNIFSRAFGRLANTHFPRPVQNFINKIYIKIFRIDMSDFGDPCDFPTLNLLFTRALKNPRTINPAPQILISPSDSKITEFGELKNGHALQIKGRSYSFTSLIYGIHDAQMPLPPLFFINFYLSPRDYHRFHAPCDLRVIEARYFSGRLLAVNEPSLRKNPRVFSENERVVLVALDDNNNHFYFVAVGALNVGKIIINFDAKIATNAKNPSEIFRYDPPVSLKKGDEIGRFLMGSTIVIFAEKIAPDPEILHRHVKFGEKIANFW